jgi:anhydro-N-acetylmuramic acid kinase
VLLDCLIQQLSNGKEKLDAGGRLAVQGRLLPELLHRWMHHPYFLRRFPKSLHRSSFAEEFARQTVALAQQPAWSSCDLLCTANHLIARMVGDALHRLLDKQGQCRRILLTGGGVRNGLLRRLLEERVPSGLRVEVSDTRGVPADAKEAMAAALLGCLTLDGVAGNVPLATGASGERLLGALTPGSLANWSRCLQWMTSQESSPIEEE